MLKVSFVKLDSGLYYSERNLSCKKQYMKILEGSDTQLIFHITEGERTCSQSGVSSNVDLTDYDKVVLEMKYVGGIVQYEGTVDNGEGGLGNSYVIFDIFSEMTVGRVGIINCDIWGIKGEKKVRFNESTIIGEILPSIIIPEGTVNE